MKRIILVAVGLATVPVAAHAQSMQETIDRATAAAPARARDDATVVRWNADHTWSVIREGTNQLVCYDRSGEPGRPAFAVQCTSLKNLERVAQSRRFEAETDTREELSAMVAAAEANGTRVLPEYGSIWYTMNGADQASAGNHTTVAVPGATTESTGIPDNRMAGGMYIMAAGTSTAHLMIPGR